MRTSTFGGRNFGAERDEIKDEIAAMTNAVWQAAPREFGSRDRATDPERPACGSSLNERGEAPARRTEQMDDWRTRFVDGIATGQVVRVHLSRK